VFFQATVLAADYKKTRAFYEICPFSVNYNSWVCTIKHFGPVIYGKETNFLER
jgi:hypothetical protein